MKILYIVGNILSKLLIVLTVFVVLGMVYLKSIGGASYVVQTGSMEPTLKPGDLVLAKQIKAEDYKIGDIVVTQPFSNEATFVTHRIVEADSANNRWVTQGDNNNVKDAPLIKEQLRGQVFQSIPKIGYVFDYVKSHLITSIAVLVAFIALLSFIPDLKKEGNKDEG